LKHFFEFFERIDVNTPKIVMSDFCTLPGPSFFVLKSLAFGIDSVNSRELLAL